MQMNSGRRTNLARSEATRTALLAAAKRLFVQKGYAETGTPELVAVAGVTRGALYHHFEDKRALFLALVEGESAAVAAEIDAAAAPSGTPAQMLHSGSAAFLNSMQKDGRTRLLLIEAPAVLGFAVTDAIDARHGRRTLREGLEAALGPNRAAALPLDALVNVLAAAFDRAAIAIDNGGDVSDYRLALRILINGLLEASARPRKQPG
jgi:AcrR family transcriptional regulator